MFKGLCSSFLCFQLPQQPYKDLQNDTIVQQGNRNQPVLLLGRVVRSSFSSIEICSTTNPIIMVCSGTGIAPFRGILRELQHQLNVSCGTVSPSSVVLFYGCRYSTVDWLYKSEIEQMCSPTEKRPPVITHFYGAFSREQEEKVYVQHRVKDQATLLQQLIINQKATVLICGSIKMGAATRIVLTDIIGLNEINGMIKNGRFIEEVWN